MAARFGLETNDGVAHRAPLRTRRYCARFFRVVTPEVEPVAASPWPCTTIAAAAASAESAAAFARRRATTARPPVVATGGGNHAGVCARACSLVGPFHVGSPFVPTLYGEMSSPVPHNRPCQHRSARRAPWLIEVAALIGLGAGKSIQCENAVQPGETINLFAFSHEY